MVIAKVHESTCQTVSSGALAWPTPLFPRPTFLPILRAAKKHKFFLVIWFDQETRGAAKTLVADLAGEAAILQEVDMGKDVEKLVWSCLPKEAYTIVIEGKRLGVGAHPALALPGSWNILWLSCNLDHLLNRGADPLNFPTDLEILPLCVASSLQHVHTLEEQLRMMQEGVPNATLTFGELTEQGTPARFIEAAAASPGFLLKKEYGGGWVAFVTERAKAWRRTNNNVVLVNFKKGTA